MGEGGNGEHRQQIYYFRTSSRENSTKPFQIKRALYEGEVNGWIIINGCQKSTSESVINTKLTRRNYHGLRQIRLLASYNSAHGAVCHTRFGESDTFLFSCRAQKRWLVLLFRNKAHNWEAQHKRTPRKKEKNDQSLPEASYSYYYSIRVDDDDNNTNDQ